MNKRQIALVALASLLMVPFLGCGTTSGTVDSGTGDATTTDGTTDDVEGGGAAAGFVISGVITRNTDSQAVQGITVTNGVGQTATTTATGRYTLRVSAGSYTITPSLTGYGFAPATRAITVGPSISTAGFTAYQLVAPQLSDATASISVVDGQYTLTGSATATYVSVATLEVFFRLVSASGASVGIPATASGAQYTASYVIPQLEAGAYTVTVVARDAAYPTNESRVELGEVLLVPPGPPA